MKIKRISDNYSRFFRQRICHVSDTHGGFPRLLGRYDVVVHSGDFLPNSKNVTDGNKPAEMDFQLRWMEDHAQEMRQWLQGTPLIMVPGNHDFPHHDMLQLAFNDAGVRAYVLVDKFMKLNGVTYFGFPYVPAIGGNIWNYERELPEMQQEVKKMVDVLNAEQVDVLICHAPLYKCLDLSYGNAVLGSTVISNALDYEVKPEKLPKYFLCGHIHESHGLSVRNGMLVSNAATTYQIIEVV